MDGEHTKRKESPAESDVSKMLDHACRRTSSSVILHTIIALITDNTHNYM